LILQLFGKFTYTKYARNQMGGLEEDDVSEDEPMEEVEAEGDEDEME
jgi:hypothetical protein